MGKGNITFSKFCRFLLAGSIIFFLVWILSGKFKLWLIKSDSFRIRQIHIHGNEIFQEKDLLAIAGLTVGSSIWNVPLQLVEENLLRNPFIEEVTISRLFPDRMIVDIREKNPIALLNFNGKFYCVDKDGLVLPSKPGKLYDMPVISGTFKGAVTIGRKLKGELIQKGLDFLMRVIDDRPEMYGRISEIVLGRPEGIIVYPCNEGIPIWMGESGYHWKIRYMEAILDELGRRGSLSEARYIDVRFRGQVVVGIGA